MVASRSALVLPWRPASGAVARRIGRGEGHVERGEFQKKGGALNSSQLNMNIFPSTPPRFSKGCGEGIFIRTRLGITGERAGLGAVCNSN